jgi:glutaredoxin
LSIKCQQIGRRPEVHPVGLVVPSGTWGAGCALVPAPLRLGNVPAAEPRVVLLSRPGCHLCDDARRVVERVVADLGEHYLERDITLDPAELREHGESIPVVFVDGVQVAYWRVSEARLRAALGR